MTFLEREGTPENPLTPLEEFRKRTNILYRMAFLNRYSIGVRGDDIDSEYLKKAFADAFIAFDNLLDDNGLTMRDIFFRSRHRR